MVSVADPSSQSYKDYLWFLFGQTFSILGSSVVMFALVWWVSFETKDPVIISISSALSFLPQLIFSLFAGVLTDRWNRKRTIIIADFLQALTTVGMIVIFITKSNPLWYLVMLNSVRGLCQSFHQPASSAIVALMVPQDYIGRINGLKTFSSSAVNLIGPIIAAALLTQFSIEQVFWIDVITFGLAMIPFAWITIPELEHSPETGSIKVYWHELGEGLKTMKEVPYLLLISFWALLTNAVLMAQNTLFAYFVNQIHGGLEEEYAFTIVLAQVGLVVGSIICSIKKSWKRPVFWLFQFSYLFFIGILISAFAPIGVFWVIGVGQMVVNFALAFAISVYYTYFQTAVPVEKQGRAFSIDAVISLAICPIAMAVAGPIVEWMGTQEFFIVAAILGIVINIIFMGIYLKREKLKNCVPEDPSLNPE